MHNRIKPSPLALTAEIEDFDTIKYLLTSAIKENNKLLLIRLRKYFQDMMISADCALRALNHSSQTPPYRLPSPDFPNSGVVSLTNDQTNHILNTPKSSTNSNSSSSPSSSSATILLNLPRPELKRKTTDMVAATSSNSSLPASSSNASNSIPALSYFAVIEEESDSIGKTSGKRRATTTHYVGFLPRSPQQLDHSSLTQGTVDSTSHDQVDDNDPVIFFKNLTFN